MEDCHANLSSFVESIDHLLVSCQKLIDTPIPNYQNMCTLENYSDTSVLEPIPKQFQELCKQTVNAAMKDAFNFLKGGHNMCKPKDTKSYADVKLQSDIRHTPESCDSYDMFLSTLCYDLKTKAASQELTYRSCSSSLNSSCSGDIHLLDDVETKKVSSSLFESPCNFTSTKGNSHNIDADFGSDIKNNLASLTGESSTEIDCFDLSKSSSEEFNFQPDLIELTSTIGHEILQRESSDIKEKQMYYPSDKRGESILIKGRVSSTARVPCNSQTDATEQLPSLELSENTVVAPKFEPKDFHLTKRTNVVQDLASKQSVSDVKVVESDDNETSRENYSRKCYTSFFDLPPKCRDETLTYISNCEANIAMPGRKGKRTHYKKRNRKQQECNTESYSISENEKNNISKLSDESVNDSTVPLEVKKYFDIDNLTDRDVSKRTSANNEARDTFQFKSAIDHHFENHNELNESSSGLYHATPVFITNTEEVGPSLEDYAIEKKVPSVNNFITSSKSFNKNNICHLPESYYSPAVDDGHNSSVPSINFLNSCQHFITIGTDSVSLASEVFATAESANKHLELSCKFVVGQVSLLVDCKTSEFPLFSSNYADIRKALYHPELYEWNLVTRKKLWRLNVDHNSFVSVVWDIDLIKMEDFENFNIEELKDASKSFTSKLYGFTLVPESNHYVKNLIPVFSSSKIYSISNKDVSLNDEDSLTKIILRPKQSKSLSNNLTLNRYSAACDVQMYRNFDCLEPDNDKNVINESSPNGPSLKIMEVSLFEDPIHNSLLIENRKKRTCSNQIEDGVETSHSILEIELDQNALLDDSVDKLSDSINYSATEIHNTDLDVTNNQTNSNETDGKSEESICEDLSSDLNIHSLSKRNLNVSSDSLRLEDGSSSSINVIKSPNIIEHSYRSNNIISGCELTSVKSDLPLPSIEYSASISIMPDCSVISTPLTSSKMSNLPSTCTSTISPIDISNIKTENDPTIEKLDQCNSNKVENLSNELLKDSTCSKSLLGQSGIHLKVLDFEKITKDFKQKYNPLSRSTTDSTLISKGSLNKGQAINTKAIDIAKLQGATPLRPVHTKFPMDIICQGRLNEIKKKTAVVELSGNENEENEKIVSSEKSKSFLYPTVRSKSAGRMELHKRKKLGETKTNSLDADSSKQQSDVSRIESVSHDHEVMVTTSKIDKTDDLEDGHLNISASQGKLNVAISTFTSKLSMSPNLDTPISDIPVASTQSNLSAKNSERNEVFPAETMGLTSSPDCLLEEPVFSKVMIVKPSISIREIKIVSRVSLSPPVLHNVLEKESEYVKKSLRKVDYSIDHQLPIDQNKLLDFAGKILEPLFDMAVLYPLVCAKRNLLNNRSHYNSYFHKQILHEVNTETLVKEKELTVNAIELSPVTEVSRLEVVFPEPIIPVSFLVEEKIDLIDDLNRESPFEANSFESSTDISKTSSFYNNGSMSTLVGDLTPSVSPVPVDECGHLTTVSLSSSSTQTVIDNKIVMLPYQLPVEVHDSSNEIKDLPGYGSLSDGYIMNQESIRKLSSKEDKKDNLKGAENLELQKSYSSRSEEEGSTSSFDRPTDPEEVLASASASSTGSPLSWGSSQGPVARRDLLPLDEDYEKTPSWQALLAVNRPDSDDERTGYESDDDFEDVDTEMRRLEEKLKKFELELGETSSSEHLFTKDINSSNKLSSKIRIRPEDIDVLKTFSLPEVFPPVDIYKTKHLSLMLGSLSKFYPDSDNDVSENSFTESSLYLNSLVLKTKKLMSKTEQRRCRSLDLQNLKKTRKQNSLSRKDLNVSIKSEVTEMLETCLANSSESIHTNADLEDVNLSQSKNLNIDSDSLSNQMAVNTGSEMVPQLSNKFPFTEPLCNGLLWIEMDSDITSFDFDGMDEIKEEDAHNSVIFIFEDDDDLEDSADYHSCIGVPADSDLSLYHSTESKIPYPQFETSSQLKPDLDLTKKKQSNLLSSFKSGFQKAAKYLGPMNFAKSLKEEGRYYQCEEEKTFLHLKASLLDQNEIELSEKGSYNIPSAEVNNLINIFPETASCCSSGEYFASPAVCIMPTSDEEKIITSETSFGKNASHSCSSDASLEISKRCVIQHEKSLVANIYPESVSCTEETVLCNVDQITTPPAPPPRTSSKEGNILFSPEKDLSTLFALDYCNDTNTAANNQASTPYSKDASESSRHKPTSLRQLKRKQKERINLQKSEDLIEASGCNFCMTATMLRGRSDNAGKHNRLPSPHPKARSEEQVATTRAWLDAEKVWLVHKGGFCAGRQLKENEEGESLPEGRVRLKLEHNEEIIQVDEDDVEKANPSTFDRCEDLSHLRFLNESSILHTLRQRYGSNLIHTYAGGAMVVLNPTTPLAIYSEKVIQMFKGCKLEDMPPHIYSAAQSTYRDLVTSRRDQSIVFLGRSGAGKTTSFRHVLHYLALAAGANNKILTVEKLNAISTLLEALGNSRTVLNTNATRFTQIFSLDFDHSGQIASASVQVYMPEKMRVARRPDGEPNYHIFYQLFSGADEDLKSYLGLDNINEPNLFMTPLQRTEDKQRAGIAWARIRAALDVLRVSQDEQKALWSVLASIYHLGTAGAVKVGNSNKYQFAKPGYAQKAASLLGISVEELARSIFSCSPSSNSSRATFKPVKETEEAFGEIIAMIERAGTSRTTSPTERILDRPDGNEAIAGIASGLYFEAFNAMVALINRCISTSAHTANSILVVDSPGFQNPASCGRSGGASFSDLCHNYSQERLQMLFHDVTFTAQTDRYAQENIECSDVTDELGTPAPLISLLDKPSSSSVVRTSQVDLKEADRRGLLWLLDEEAIFPGASDQSFTQRLLTHYGDREYSNLLKKGKNTNEFMLNHFQGTNPVSYCTNGWLKASRENPVARQAAAILQESNKESLSRVFVFSRGPVSNTISGSVVGIEGSQSLRRASSIRRAFTTGTASIKRKSVCLQVKFTVDGIIETLRRTKLKFVHCLLPQHNAGLCDLKGMTSSSTKANGEDILLNVPLVRSQIRGSQILDALRIHKQGFPEHLQYSEFRRRFTVLAPAEARPQQPVSDEKSAVESILCHLDLDASSYRIGLSQIFFRTGTISRLEEQRDLVLTDTVIRLQAVCRGVLARRRLNKRKVQELAIRCIQKNVKKFMAVRDWPWWRLLVRVTPLLNVHRTEEELKSTKDELETLRNRLEKSDKERADLKHDNDKLEARLSNMAVNRTSKANASNDSSTLEDLSSGSDDDFYDVHPLPGYFCIPGRPQLGFRDHYGAGIGGLTIAPGRPFIVGPPPPSPRGPVPHSYSLPAVNKLKPTTKLGNSLASPQLKGRKKYPAPPPPLSREGSFVSNESSIQNCGVDGSPATNKKPQRSPSLKKYPAPQPPLSSAPTNGQTVMFKTSSLPRDTSRRSLHCEPTSLHVVNGSTNYCSSSSQHSSTRDESQTQIMSPLLIAGDIVSDNNKASLSHRDSKIISKETEKTFESQAVKVSSILSPNDIEKHINEPLTVTNSSNLKSEFNNSKTSDVSNASLNTNHSEVLSCQLSSGKDVSRPELLDVSSSAADYNLNKVNKDNNIKELGSNNPVLPTDNKLEMGRKKRHNKSTNDLQKDTNKVSSRRGSSSREDDKSSQGSSRSSSRGVTPDPSGNVKIGSVKTKSGKLAALANRFEDDKSKPNEVRSKPPPPKPIVINLGKKSASSLVTGMASRFGGDGPKPKETTKVQSPYSKPFEPQSTLQEKKKNSIGGITVASKFGDIVKPINFKKVKEKEQKTLTTPVKDNNDESEISKDVKRSNQEANSVAVDKVIKNVEKPTNEKDRLNKKKKMKEERLSDVNPNDQVDVTSAEKVVEEKKEKLLTIETSLSETGVNVSGEIENNIKNSHQQNPNNSEHNQEELKNSLSKADVPKEMSHLDGTINKDLKINLLTKENLSSKDITISNSETDTTSIKQSTGTQVLTKNFEQEKSNYGLKHISTKLNSKNALQNLPKEVDLVVDPKSATKEDLKAASNNVPKNIADIPEEGALDESTTNNVHETVSNSIPANIINVSEKVSNSIPANIINVSEKVSNSIPANIINVSEKTADPVVGSVLKDTPENNIKIVPVKTANDDLENITENASEKDPDNAINNVLESVSIDVTENEKVVSESGLKNSLKSISGNDTALLSESLSKDPVQETLKNSKEYDASEILNSTNISEVSEPEIKSLTQKEEIPIIIETETKESKIQVESTKSINDACTIMENNDKIPEVLPQLNDIANSAQSESAVSSPRDINITTNDSNLTENPSLDITASLKNEDNLNENQNIVLNEVQTASESEDKIESSKESNANDLPINTDLISSNLKLLEETSISDTSISPLLANSDIETLKIAVQSTNNELTEPDNTKPIITKSTTLARLVDNESIDQLSMKLKLECSGDEISDLNPQVIHERLEIPVTIAFDDNENSPSVPSDHIVASRKIITSLPSDSIYLPSKLSKEIQSLRHVDSVIFGPGSVPSSLGSSGLNSYKSKISEYNAGTTTSALSTMPLLSQGTLPSSVSSSITSSDKATTQKSDAQEDSILSPTSLLQGMVNSLKTSFSKVLLNSTNNSNQQASTVPQDNVGTSIAIPVNLEILNNKLISEVKIPSALSENESISSMERRGARSKKSPRNIAIPDEVLYVSDIIKNAEERLNVALQKNPLKIKNADGKEEIFLDAFDSTQFDTLMPLPLSEELNPSDYRSRSCTPFRESFERAATPSRAVQQTEAILSETDRILRKTRSQHSLRRSFTRSLSGISINRLAEVSADLNEEHSTSHMAGERIEAEQAERMRLEKEVSKLQLDVKQMTNVTDQLEMEKLALRSEVLQHSELNGDFNDLDEAADASLYKRKYEWCIREMEVLKKQLKQQQEDDYDQLIILKKQLEKKVSDAYEETDEQRQIVGQLKKKSQRLQAEMNDMKILLEEQTSRNNLLEKKQRKFDQDMLSVQEDHRNERLTKDKIQREKDQILSEKYSYEQEVSTLKLELDLKEEKINSLTKELNDLSFTGKAEEEVALLKKAKHDLELRVKDQEEELDDLAGQVQMLEGAKIRLEMSIEQMRKENRKEAQQREEEIEEIRMGAQKKLKALESQLECEHEERTQLVREKHDLERRLADAHERTFATVDEDSFHKVKKELKKTKALLKDTQTMLEKTQSEGSNKLLLRQLKTQLEDVEFAKTAAVKARQSAESDLTELQIQLDEVSRAKKDSEERCLRLSKEKTEIQTQLEESEEEVAEVMKKYKATVSQLSVDQINISEQSQIIADLEHDKQILSDRLTEMTSKVEVLEGETANIHTQRRLQMKIKELESKLELEQTTKTRLESQISRLKDQVEKVCSEMESIRLKESQAGDYSKKLNRQLRESKEDFSNLQQKHTDAISRKQDLEKQQELSESEIITLKSDLKLAFKRIEDLQQALQGDLSDSDTELTDSDSESDTSLTSYLTASAARDRSKTKSPLEDVPTDSNAEMLVCSPTTAQMMSAIREDEEDEDFKESFA